MKSLPRMIPLAESCFSIILTPAMIKAVRLVNIGHLGNMAVLVVAILLGYVVVFLRGQNIDRFVIHALQLAMLVVEADRAGVLLVILVVTTVVALVCYAIQLAGVVVEVDRADVILATPIVTIVAAFV